MLYQLRYEEKNLLVCRFADQQTCHCVPKMRIEIVDKKQQILETNEKYLIMIH